MRINQLGLTSLLVIGIVIGVIPFVPQTKTDSLAASVKQQTDSLDPLAALNNIQGQSNKLKELQNAGMDNIRLVNVKDVLDEKNLKTFEEAVKRNSEEILRLQDVIAKNELLKEVLSKNNVSLKDVVALNLISARELVVFYLK